MKEIYQAFVSLGPLIASSVFSLRADEREAPCTVNQQDSDGEYEASNSARDVDITQTAAFSIKGAAENSSADPPHCYERRANLNIASGDASVVPVVPIGIKTEAESCPMEEEMMPTVKQSSGNGTRKRRKGESHIVKYSEKTTAFEESIANANKTIVQDVSYQTSPGFHPDLQTDQKLQGNCSTERENAFSQPVSSELQQRTSEDDGLYKYGESNSDMKNKLTCVQQQNTREPCRQYTCAEGVIGFTQKQDLFNQGTHASEKIHLYTMCKKGFSERNTLIRHQRSHRAGLPFSCTECGRRFKHSSTLLIHRRTHTGEKPYACNECGRCFSHKPTLLNHERLHTGEKPYVCAACGMRFHQSAALSYHQNSKKH